MPGFNGTGPQGMGPMTGGARGFCRSGRIAPGRRNMPFSGNFGFPRGGSRRRMRGTGRFNELDILQDEAKNLRDELRDLESRISQISESETSSD